MPIDRVPYWIDLADYDIETAETLYNGGRWLYVAFMCHQAIEKTLKAYWCDTLHTDPSVYPQLESACRRHWACQGNDRSTIGYD